MSLYTGTESAVRDISRDLGSRKGAASYVVSAAIARVTDVLVTTSVSGAGVSPVLRAAINNQSLSTRRNSAWPAITAALLVLGVALLVAGLAASLFVGVSWAAGLFPVGATILFIATLVAGFSRKGGHSWGQN